VTGRGWQRWPRVWVVLVAVVGVVAGLSSPANAIITAGDGGGTGGTTGCMNTSSGTFTASMATAQAGWPVTLSWQVYETASDCWAPVILAADGSSQQVSTSGSMSVTPPVGTTSWDLRVTSPNGSATVATVSVTVTALASAPSMAVTSDSTGRLQYFEVDSNDTVSRSGQAQPNSGFGQLYGGPGSMRSITAALNGDNQIMVVGTNATGQIFQNLVPADGSSWSSWTPIDGALSSVAVAREPSGLLSLFGVNQIGQVFGRPQSGVGGTGWAPWQYFDGPAMRQVAVANNADGRFELFAIDAAGTVYHRSQTAVDSGWSGWGVLSGASLATIAATRMNDGRLQLIGTDTGGSFHTITQNSSSGATGWGSWKTEPYAVAGSIAAGTDADGRVDVVALENTYTGEYAHLGQRDPGSDTTPWTDWTNLKEPLLDPLLCTGYARCEVADVNGDRVADLVEYVLNSRPGPDQGDIWVALGNSDNNSARFQPTPQKWGDSLCVSGQVCTLADVNGDRAEDEIIETTTGTNAGQVSVALSTTTGFAAPTVWTTSGCRDLDTCRFADINYDHAADLVRFVRSSTTAVDDGNVWVLPSNGGGGFAAHPSPTFDAPQLWATNLCLQDQQCRLGDVNGDQTLDVVAFVTTGTNQGQAWVSLGTPASFGTATMWTTNSQCVGAAMCALADLNNDQRDDIVAKATDSLTDELVWVASAGDASFGAPVQQTLTVLSFQSAKSPTQNLTATCQALELQRQEWELIVNIIRDFGTEYTSMYVLTVLWPRAEAMLNAINAAKARLGCP
jgi:Tectonin domain